MNKISDERINSILTDTYEYLKTIYNEDRLLGIFTQGIVNYGFAEKESEINFTVGYLPTFEELCTTAPTVKDIEYNNKKISIVDIRETYQRALRQQTSTMETVFTKYKIINPRYKQIFDNSIYINKELIYRINQKSRVTEGLKDAEMALDNYYSLRKSDYLFDAVRLRIAAERYMEGTSVENCIFPKQDYIVNYLWSIKNGEYTPDIEVLEKELAALKERAEILEDSNQKDLIKKGLCEIIRLSMTDAVYGKKFLNILTKNEIIALDTIKKHLVDNEGNLTIAQLVEDSDVSRPVYTSLLQKMKENGVAEVVNQGVKGTYIKILDKDILN